MSKRRLSEEEINRAIEMRERGLSLELIGRDIGRSAKALSWLFLKLAVDPPKPPKCRPNYHLQCPVLKRGNHVVRAFTPDEDMKLLALEAEGLSVTQIARALGRRWNSTRGRLMTLARQEERGAR
jgi:hypothetical protein